ncbi:MAG: spore coat protein CotH [Planctomycetes bacterium]|nr:spore coat protein CotH [Planctomycetota bacterium]
MNKRIAGLLGAMLLVPWLGGQPDGVSAQDPKKGPGFGGFGGPGGPSRQLVKQFDKDGDGRLDDDERKAARDFIKKEREKGGGFGGFGGKGGKGPGGFGQPGGGFATLLVKPILAALDKNDDGKLSKDEVLAGVKKFFTDLDKDENGSITEAQLAEGLNRIFPQPKGFPGGPGGPGGFPGGKDPGGFPGGPGGPGAGPGGPGGFPGGPPGGLPRPGEILPGFLQQQLKLTAEQRKELEKLQKEIEAKLDKLLTEEQRKTLRDMRRRMSGGFPGGPGPDGQPPVPGKLPKGPKDGPFGPPGGIGKFGPGNMFAGNIRRRVDSNKDGKITLNELNAATEKAFKDADRDKDGMLDEKELGAAIGQLFMPGGFGPGGPGGFGPGGFPGGKGREPAKPGPRVKPDEVKVHPDAPLYDPNVLRTLFIDFPSQDWEAELADFYRSDVEVPATLTVDGKKYENVGVHFRGMSSFFAVPAGYKRSLNLSLGFVNKKQQLHGYKTLNLLNAHDDPTLMHTVLFSHIARQHIPAPKANYVKVVINGESWGIYVNAQQFNKNFLVENYKTAKGARWKVQGSPGAGGGLDYIGDNIEDYKRRYQIKSKDRDKDWKALITLCRTLDQTPPDKLEAALKPMLDIDGVLWFLALDNAVINGDGYWTRASDYSIYRDPRGVFHVIPHDTNETFQPAMNFGFGGFGPKGGGKDGARNDKGGIGGRVPAFDLDPLVGLNDARKPLRSKLLAVPALRERYLDNVRRIAESSFDWAKLKPVIDRYRALIEKEVEVETRKLYSLADFQSSHVETAPAGGGRGASLNLRRFADQRRAFLLNHEAIKKAGGA